MFAACQESTGPGEASLRLSLEKVAFELDPTVDVLFTLSNRGGATVYVPACGDQVTAEIQRREGGAWAKYSGDLCVTVLPMSPLAVASGEALQGTRSIAEPGRYRLLVRATSTPSADGWLTVTSNAFTVE